MARDYAKNKKKKKKSGASRGKKNASISKSLLVTTFILFCGLAALLVYLKYFQPETPSGKTTSSNKIETTTKQTKQSDQKTAQPDKKQTDDEVPFYRTHEEMINKTVEIPIEDLKLPDDKNKYEYLMPCGSFRDSARAEELKAQIAFVGFESTINQVQVESGLWHRVELGPFSSKRKTESIRHRLQDNGFEHCKIWRKKLN